MARLEDIYVAVPHKDTIENAITTVEGPSIKTDKWWVGFEIMPFLESFNYIKGSKKAYRFDFLSPYDDEAINYCKKVKFENYTVIEVPEDQII